MEYISPEEAQGMAGLRLALTADVPAPYSMSAKAVFDHHGVSFVPVRQQGGGRNEALVAWTRHRNAPVAVYNDEAPRIGWLEILNLAERLGTGPSLLPDDLSARREMIGWTNELIGENGVIWNMRIVMLGLGGPERAAKEAERNPMYGDYGYSEEARETALAKVQETMAGFTEYAAAADERYLAGERLSALDIYWVYFSQIFKTLPEELSPTPSYLKKSYDMAGAAFGACNPALIERRDWILANHLQSPMEF